MKGLTEELWLNIINAATKTNKTIIGASHQAFLTFKKSHNSPSNVLLFDIILTKNLDY